MLPTAAASPTADPQRSYTHYCRRFLSTDISYQPQRHDVVRWSPDGSEVFFGRYSVGRRTSDPPRSSDSYIPPATTIYAVAADGSQLREVRRTVFSNDFNPSSTTSFDVSPDGSSLVYSTCEFPNPRQWSSTTTPQWHYSFDLARVNVDGSQVTRLIGSQRFESLPAWSPDGTRIAFVGGTQELRTRRSLVRLHTMTPDGDNVRAIEAGIAAFYPPSWSPDGQQLAFVALIRHTDHDTFDRYGRLKFARYVIRTVAADGSDSKRLTETVSGPSWSPDGTRIAFAMPSPDGDGVALFTIAVDGSDRRRVAPIDNWVRFEGAETDPARGWVPTVAWSPTGEHIMFVDGRVVKVVTPDGDTVGSPPILFEGVPVPAWSPDGSRIAIAAPVDGYFTESQNLQFKYEVVVTVAPDGTDLVPLVRASPTDQLVAVQSARYRADSVAEACSAGYVVANPATNPGLLRDCETLAGLRDALIGRLLVNWTADTDIREWAGVFVDGAPTRVVGLTLSIIQENHKQSLTYYYWPGGTLPPALSALTELRTLDLSAGELQGTIPPELGRLSKLEHLDLSGNQGLWGELPKELGDLTSLQVLNLAGNQFEGPIPPELGNLANLRVLNLANNKFKGPIPPELGRLVNLKTLFLSGNRFSGCIPPELHGTAKNDLAKLKLPDCKPG